MCNVAIISCRLTAVFYTYICSFITAARISDDINIFKMAAVCHFEFAKFWFFGSRDGSWNQNLHWHTKLHKNRMICGWDIAIKPKAKGLYKSYSQSVAPYHIYPPAFNYYSSPAVPLRGEGSCSEIGWGRARAVRWVLNLHVCYELVSEWENSVQCFNYLSCHCNREVAGSNLGRATLHQGLLSLPSLRGR